MPQKLTGVVGQFVRLFAADLPGVPDGELLGRYLATRDEPAFSALVRRHGPMVLGVCRRILHNESDIDDAFQATFLVLVRKASSIKPRGMVGNWLHGVAYQTAVRARSLLARRRGREISMPKIPETAQPDTADLWIALEPVIDRELHGLPEKYRIPIILCDLEGMSRKEAALHLKWPEGTVAGRLSRGRKLLANRLTRRGVSLTVASLVATLSGRAALAQLPLPLVHTTLKATMLFVAGSSAGAISALTAELTQGVLTAMFISKLKTAATVLLVLSLIGFGSSMLTQPDASAQPPYADPRTQPDRMPPHAMAARGGTVWEGMFEDGESAVKRNLDIQGVWILQSAVTGGQSVKDDIQIVLKNNLMIWNEKGSVMGFSYKINSDKEPNQIDLTSLEEGKTKGKMVLGIYKCDGDTLTLCESAPGRERPTHFSATKGPGAGTSLQMFRRASAGKATYNNHEPNSIESSHPVPSPYFPPATTPRSENRPGAAPETAPPVVNPALPRTSAPTPETSGAVIDPNLPLQGGFTDLQRALIAPHLVLPTPKAPSPSATMPAYEIAPPAAKNETEYSFTASVSRQILRDPEQPATLAFPKITLDANQQATVSIQEGELEYSLKIKTGNGSNKAIHRLETTISRVNSEGRIVQIVANSQMSIHSDRDSGVTIPITKDGATEISVKATKIAKQPDSSLQTR